jgi:hypothetical protein
MELRNISPSGVLCDDRVSGHLSFVAERLMWWHGGTGLTERSERGSLSAVATHDVFCILNAFAVRGNRSNRDLFYCLKESGKVWVALNDCG